MNLTLGPGGQPPTLYWVRLGFSALAAILSPFALVVPPNVHPYLVAGTSACTALAALLNIPTQDTK